MEKFARDAINDERIKCKEDIVVSSTFEFSSANCLLKLLSIH